MPGRLPVTSVSREFSTVVEGIVSGGSLSARNFVLAYEPFAYGYFVLPKRANYIYILVSGPELLQPPIHTVVMVALQRLYPTFVFTASGNGNLMKGRLLNDAAALLQEFVNAVFSEMLK